MFDEKPIKKFQERFYQKLAIDKAINDLNEFNKSLIVMATGTGKNLVLNSIAKHYIDNYKYKVLIICDRNELIDQLFDTSKIVLGEHNITKEKGEFKANLNSDCTIASIQTINKDNRLERFNKDHYNLIIIDECHKMMNKSYFKVIEHFSNSKVLGLTATPERSDDNQLGDFFDRISYQYNLSDGVKDGFLCKIKGKRITDIANIDISDLKFNDKGEFDQNSEKTIERRILENIDAIINSIYNETNDKKTLIFTVSVNVSDIMAKRLRDKGLKAESISYKTNDVDRLRIINEYRSNKITHLVNCTLLTVGFDCPDIEAIYMAKATNSRVLYSQAIGRGTRIYTFEDGREKELTIYELTFNSNRHSIANTWQLFQNGNIKFTDKIINKVKHIDNEVDLFQTLNNEVIQEKYESLKRIDRIRNKSNNKTIYEFVEYDPLEIGEFLDIDFESIRYNNKKLKGYATSKMVDFLRKYNIKKPELLRKSQASAIIDLIIQNRYSMKNIDKLINEKYNKVKNELNKLMDFERED